MCILLHCHPITYEMLYIFFWTICNNKQCNTFVWFVCTFVVMTTKMLNIIIWTICNNKQCKTSICFACIFVLMTTHMVVNTYILTPIWFIYSIKHSILIYNKPFYTMNIKPIGFTTHIIIQSHGYVVVYTTELSTFIGEYLSGFSLEELPSLAGSTHPFFIIHDIKNIYICFIICISHLLVMARQLIHCIVVP